MESKKTELIGKVVSAKCDKTITVMVETYRTDPLYKKRVKYSKKYYAHDEKNTAKEGDTVLIFKKKRRKSFQKLNGHRQSLSEIEIQSINL